MPAAVDLPDGQRVWTGRLSLPSYPWLADHQVLGQVLLPGVVWVELALHAGHRPDATLSMSSPCSRRSCSVRPTRTGEGRRHGDRRARHPHRVDALAP
ncbi:hypothetical protein [Streptomyces sp. SGAir0924]|uniref:hypothetical protein n=1 Tax=Streptomyces sp. SGAir0924 TaxID=2109593 RepID=UPI0034A0C6E9